MSRLIGLQCPQCRKNVEGENHSLVFICRRCRLAFDVSEKTARFSINFTKAQVKRNDPQVYFPFWLVEAQYIILTNTNKSQAPVKEVFIVPAYFNKYLDTFSDIGWVFYKKRISLMGDNDRNWPIHPANRPASSAVHFPMLYLQKRCSENRGGDKPEIEMGEQRLMLVLIPFYHTGGQYIDSQLGISCPQGALL